jgi:hypothetical protein
MAGGTGFAWIISGIIRGDPVSISIFTIVFISLITYTSYFKKMFPKVHEYINKVSSNK